jgi:2-amino-4-hydroxy-6-hydroxymethyldihydropteridine diphosphokinase
VVGFDRVEGVDLTLTKLRPPIGEHVETTAVRISRTVADFDTRPRASHRAIVALGSNLGDRNGHLRFALGELGGVVAQSQVFETEPVGGPDAQSAYLNMVAVLDTPLDPFAFLRRCQRIESAALRERTVAWGPRTLDVDVLFYDGVTVSSPELTIPHPLLGQRRFVLAPLAEVAPERCPPGWETSLAPGGVSPRGPLVG